MPIRQRQRRLVQGNRASRRSSILRRRSALTKIGAYQAVGVPVFDLLLALWPLFALIVAGYYLRRWEFPNEAFWPGAERLNYFVLFPALLFSSLAMAPLNNPALPRLALAVLLGLGIAWLALLLMRRLRGWPAGRFGAFSQGILRFNTYLGLAAVGSLFGQQGLTLAALMLALMVPTVNVLSVWSLTAERGVSARSLLLPILKNPLILACIGGALANLSGVGLPGGSDRLLGLLAAASLPLGLLCVGAALKPEQLGREVPALAWNSGLRLLAMPLLAWAVAYGLRLPAMESSVLVLFFALPTAPTAYVLTRQLGGDSQLMVGIITLQTLLAAGSLSLVLLVLAAL
jgi:malonate transporter and related proteins